MNDLIQKLVGLQPIYQAQGKKYRFKRFLFRQLNTKETSQSHLTGISGLRGSGKTVLLLQLLNTLPNSFYISIDTIEGVSLFEIAKYLTSHYQIKYLLLDEIHYSPNWQSHLKQIYDILELKVFFTSSVSLDVLSAREDLARRVHILKLPILSFREYLAVQKSKKIPRLSLSQILASEEKKANLELEGLFLEYLISPLASQIEDKTPQLITNIVEKVINYDLAGIVALSLSDKVVIKQTLKFLASIDGGDISLTQLALNLKVQKHKMQRYVELLEKAFLIHVVSPRGKNVLKEPKILLNLPFRYYLSNQDIDKILGSFKEDFFITMFRVNKYPIFYLKTKRGRKTPDFYIQTKDGNHIIEVGGKNKGYSQFKGIEERNKTLALYPYLSKKNAVPLYLFGFLY